MPRWYSVRPGTFRIGSAALAFRSGIAKSSVRQGIAHELVEGHHHRHRIAGQAEERGVADPAERHRPARPHGDLPEEHLAEPAHQLLDEVGLAHRHAARGDDGVGLLRFVEGLFQERGVVAHHAEVADLDAEAGKHAVERVAVRVVDLAFPERRADGGELIPGGEERHAQPAPDGDLAHAQGCDEADLGRAQQLAGPEHRQADLQILPRVTDVLRLFLPRRHDDALAVLLHHLLDHHRIGARRHDCPGHDAHALARADAALELAAGESGADLLQWNAKVGEAHRVAVHR
jgi:hypothetical protein